MSIPTQLPPMIAAVRSGPLQMLALQAGQMVDGRVIGAAPNGGTQVEIRGQMLNLLLPLAVKAGETLKFEVQGSGAQMRLALQAPASASATPSAPTPQPAAGAANPAAPATPAVAAPLPSPTAPAMAAPPAVSGYPSPAAAMPAAPAMPPPVAALAGATTPPPAAPALAPTSDGTRPVSAALPSGSATGQPAPAAQTAPASPPISPAPAATPQAALAQMVHAAAPRQGTIMALTTALTAIAGQVALPEPVLRAAQQILGRQIAIDAPGFSGGTLQSALRGSGLFQEAMLARGQAPLPQTDLKSALLGLRQSLGAWLGPEAPLTPVAQIAPPLRGNVPRARFPEPPPLDPEAGPETVGRQVLERTESALARLRLHQHASLPDPVVRGADWSVDLPILAGGQPALLHIQIHRDAQSEGDAEAAPGWQLRFAINLAGLGEVGAQVSLRGGATGVMLWAAEPQTAQALEAGLGELRAALAGAGLSPGALVVRHGAPPAPPTAPSGHFVDARR